jgi:hypothetical protein
MLTLNAGVDEDQPADWAVDAGRAPAIVGIHAREDVVIGEAAAALAGGSGG